MEITTYTEQDTIVTRFVIAIIDEAMNRFNISFNEVMNILSKLKYWEVLNDTDIALVGAHEGIEPVLKEMENYMK